MAIEVSISTAVQFCRENWLHISGIALVLFLLLPRNIQLMVSISWFVFGAVSTVYFMRDVDFLPNWIPSLKRQKIKWEKDGDDFCVLKKKCPVCGKEKCERHRPEINFLALQPWANMKIPKKIDDALEELLDLVLKEHVYPWYSDVSEDEAFVDEIKTNFKFVASVALRRLMKIDVPQFIQTKILRTLIRHLHFYLEVKRKAAPGVDLEQAVLDRYGRHLHVAVRNRKAELEYLSHMANQLFPLCLHIHTIRCRSLCILIREILSSAVILPAMDALAQPDIVNNILILLFDETPPVECPDPHSPLVHILANFSKPLCHSQTKLGISLSDILADPESLFPFMQFMKAEAAVNVLQFYLTVEEFNNKILQPDLNDVTRAQLHEELQQLFNMYINPEADVDTISFPVDLVTQIQDIVDGPPEGVVKLQTSTPLFKAYDYAYELLDQTFLPLYHQSDDYYKFTCGKRISCRLQKSASTLNKKNNGSITFKIGNKLKEVFKANTVDGKVDNTTEYDAQAADEKMDDEDFTPEFLSYRSIQYKMWEDGPLRDLSAWRITIPSVTSHADPDNSRRSQLYYSIEVHRVDVLEDDFECSSWTVPRQYNEFYIFDQKLTEFHGDFEGIVLPAKRVFTTKNQEYLESKRALFQTYLQKLLTLPNLKGSELLYHFLTSDLELASSFLPDINISKLVKTGALKLVKERGQHLEPFLESFLKSIESLKPIPSRKTDQDSETISIASENLSNSIFHNNADRDLLLTRHSPLHLNLRSVNIIPVDGATDMIIYLMDYVYACASWFHSALLSLRFLFRGTLDALFDYFLHKKINKISRDFRVEKIIHEIRDILFFDTDPPRTDEQKQARKDNALNCLKDIFPKVFVLALGKDEHGKGTELMFEALQKPKLNKQLSYMLLDEVLKEAFPELLSNTNNQYRNNSPFNLPYDPPAAT